MHRERVSENVFWFQSEVYAQAQNDSLMRGFARVLLVKVHDKKCASYILVRFVSDNDACRRRARYRTEFFQLATLWRRGSNQFVWSRPDILCSKLHTTAKGSYRR